MSAWQRLARARRGVVAGMVAAAVIAGGLVTTVPAQAATFNATAALASFDPGNIISNEVMFNPGAMSQAAIQTFMNAQVPTCRSGYTCLKDYTQTTTTIAADPMCAKYTGAANETSAAIIFNVAQACGVNPEVLLVILQKEQSLVTDDWPGASQYRKATGYGCPDSATSCDATYNGFFNQVYKAAWAMRRYTSPAGTSGPGWSVYNQYPVGRPVGILYNPSTSCGSKTVTIANQATASLYYYTPYTPNAATLAAGFGTAPCGAYGNRNFFLYFTEWFGSTHYTVTGAIQTLYKQLGSGKGVLGNPTNNATVVSASVGGTAQTFQGGTIYSSPAGTVVVSGAVLAEYRQFGGPTSALGWPRAALAASKWNGGGSVQAFQGGTIYSSKAGTYSVTGALHAAYDAAGYQRGSFGWPTTDVLVSSQNGGGTSQGFAGGVVLQGGSGPAIAMANGTFLTEYVRRGGFASTLGWPITAVQTVAGHGGGTQELFQLGGLYRSAAGQFGVLGQLAKNYAAHGSAAGVLGWPTGVARSSAAAGGGGWQVFNGGRIYWSNAAGAYAIGGSFLKEYLRRDGPSGSMGWPTAGGVRVSAHSGGTMQAFQSGDIFTSKFGTFAVRGAILASYLAYGNGPAGGLGWPKGSAHSVGKTTVQLFQGGSITWTATGGAHITRHN